MLKTLSRAAGFVLVAVVVLFAAEVASVADELNRSIYVPVQISLDGEFKHAVLYRGDEALRPLPGKQVFQFTYYPNLRKLVPEAQELHVIAYRKDGTSVDVGLVVTSCTVYFGDKSVALDMKKMLKQLRHRVDYHYDPVKLTLAGGETASGDASEETLQN
jgi:hypothetical protein